MIQFTRDRFWKKLTGGCKACGRPAQVRRPGQPGAAIPACGGPPDNALPGSRGLPSIVRGGLLRSPHPVR